MIKKPRILAPAGSPECIRAAVRCGADAVYFGLKGFNARINAENFGSEQMQEAARYCRAGGISVHVTMNTLVSDDEIPAFLSALKDACCLGADAVILQDIGMAALVKKAAPSLERHASTQMSVQTVSGINLLEEKGYCTAVLPRELTKDEIVNIKKNTGIPLEMFVHGALCMCVSGQCYLSSMLGGRSGNRGLCAQPCRLPFSVSGGTGHDLSLKDLSLAKEATELSEIGIDLLKIEGRMKRPEYVAAAVTSVRCALGGEENEDVSSSLRAVFSRSGFTDGYYRNARGRDMFGTRTKQDVTAASSKVLSSLGRLYDKEKQTVPVDFLLTVQAGEKVSLAASSNGKSVFVSEDFIPEKAISKPSTEELLSQRLEKCGGTRFYAEKIEIDLDEGLSVPAGIINSLRRNALEQLEAKLSAVKPKPFTDIPVKIVPHKTEGALKFRVRVADPSQIPDNLDNVENLYFPLEDMEKYVEKVKNLSVTVGVELPRGIFGRENEVSQLLSKAKSLGIGLALCGTIDSLALARQAGFEIHTDFSMNVFNSLSIEELEAMGVKSITLSPELTLAQIKSSAEAFRAV